MPDLGKREYQKEEFIAAFLAPENLGQRTLLTQHFLGQPFFKLVTLSEIIVEWQQIAAHEKGQIDEDGRLVKQVSETFYGMSYMEQRYLKVGDNWKIAGVKPSILFETGGLAALRK
ncbi:NTF2-like protein [Penicillium lividum]|nr:NTF2-like protein [Penicillium lividum]